MDVRSVELFILGIWDLPDWRSCWCWHPEQSRPQAILGRCTVWFLGDGDGPKDRLDQKSGMAKVPSERRITNKVVTRSYARNLPYAIYLWFRSTAMDGRTVSVV